MSWLRATAALALLGTAVSSALPAGAAPALNDCTRAAWVNNAAALFSDLAGMQCETLEVSQTQDVNVRLVQDARHPEPDLAYFQPLISAAAKRALGAYKAAQPSLALQNVTLIVSPSAAGNAVAAADKGLNGECLVVVLTGSGTAKDPARRDLGVRFAVAHELVHCVQQWSVPQQMALPQGVRKWWVEGTADALATTVVEDPSELSRAITDFEGSLSTPLTQLEYATSVFFTWFAKARGGAGAVFSFMAQTPTSGGETQQRAALVSAVGADALQQFAQDYASGALTTLKGTPYPAPVLDQITITAPTTRMVEQPSFNVLAGKVVVEGGAYKLTASAQGTPAPKFKLGTEAWGDAPAKVGSSCAPGPVLFAGFATGGPSGAKLTIDAAPLDANPAEEMCEMPKPACTPLPKRDPCLVGAWRLDARGVETRVDQALGDTNPAATVNGDVALIIKDDGSSTIDFDRTEGGFDLIVGTTANVAAIYELTFTGKAEGSWSAQDGVFRMCKSSDTVKLTSEVNVFLGGDPITTTTVDEGVGLEDAEYTCAGDQLILKRPFADEGNPAPAFIVFERQGSCAVAPTPSLVALVALAGWRRRRRAPRVG